MSDKQAPSDFGRVDEDGTVWVQTTDGERNVGQVPDATPEEAMAFYTRRYENLAAEIGLLESRVKANAMSPEEARKAVATSRTAVEQANAVGNLPALLEALDKIEELLPAQMEARKKARAEQNAVTIASKQAKVDEAEKLAVGNDWRGGVDRFRALLDEWKALPRIDRSTDNDLWHKFSTARTAYTRRRKAHFSELNSRRDEVKSLKEQIIKEAEPLAASTDWGPTSGAFRDLMARWKAAGSARRSDDDALWGRFRAIQDQFFDARTAAQSVADGEQSENLAAKIALVDKVEADLANLRDVEKAKAIHREFLTQFNEVGHIPRAAMRDLDSRVRALGDRVAGMEAEEWRRTDPEARKRAEDTVALFQAQVDKLNRDVADADAAGDDRRSRDAAKSLETYNSWLDQAKETLREFQQA